MEIKHKIFTRRSGRFADHLTARIAYFDKTLGRNRSEEKIFKREKRETDKKYQRRVQEYIDARIIEIRQTHGQIATGDKMTFNDLADRCTNLFYKEAVIYEGKKIEGVRSLSSVKSALKLLRRHFGKSRIRSIEPESLAAYRSWRLTIGSQTPSALKKLKETGEKTPIRLSTVNRELAVMRRMMRYAYQKRWVLENIFEGSKVIDTTAETERKRILTTAEESRLLDACQGTRKIEYTRNHYGKVRTVKAEIDTDNPHLKAIILLAIDAGMRRGEIVKLRWKDIDFGNDLITVVGTHTKTERTRIAPLTERVKEELNRVREITPGGKIFPFDEFKRSWNTALRIAGIEGLHFHDLRRTAITRWQQYGFPIALAGKMAGHTQLATTMKYYTNTDAETVQEFADKMNRVHAASETAFDADAELIN